MNNRSMILAIIVVTYVMIVLDISIVLTGLPRIQAELGFTEAGLSWVSTAYTLCFGGFLLLGARLGDVYGRRRMFLTGVAVFAFASLIIGIAQGPAVLVVARALQGMGAAILAPATLALLQVSFAPGAERTRALAAYAAAAGVSASFGLVLGGVLADLVSWRAGFFLNLPISLGLGLAALRYVAGSEQQGGRIDLPGAVTSTLGIGALVYGTIHAATAGWHDPVTLGIIAAGLLALALFLLGQFRAAEPLLPLRLFASRERSGAYLARVLFLGANVSFYFFMSQYFQEGLGYSALTAGLAFLPTTLVNFGAALSGPKLIARFGSGAVLITSLGASLMGFAGLARISPDSNVWLGLMLPMVALGFGQGGALAPLTQAGISGAAARDAGAASGLVNVAHQIGSSLGLAVLITVAAPAGGIIARTAWAMTGGAMMIALTLAVALAFGLAGRPRTHVAR